MSDMEFFIERPADEYGNTGRPKAVIGGWTEPHDLFPAARRLHVQEPREMAQRWPTLTIDSALGASTLVPCEGPARMLTDAEWAAIVGFEIPEVAE